MINISTNAVDSIQDNVRLLTSVERGNATIAVGLFALANAVETGLLGIAKAIASGNVDPTQDKVRGR
jgi:hypothetical protein